MTIRDTGRRRAAGRERSVECPGSTWNFSQQEARMAAEGRILLVEDERAMAEG